ncbi:MAG: hypothetical protein R3281_07225 [Balneolaceae bacterium]|nr:hypothetical protein [Balneolaceae bacterium]
MLVFVSFSNCDNSFSPLKENTQYPFSIYGYLDASVDTQWVRVAPTRNQLEMSAAKPFIRVTLTELETDQSTAMNDSLFRLPNGVHFINVWTTMDIKPEHTYRLVAERPDGETSSVIVTIPKDFPTPKLIYGVDGCSARLEIEEVEHLADIQSVWILRSNSSGYLREEVRRFSYRSTARERTPNDYYTRIYADREKEKLNLPAGRYNMSERYIFVAAAGREWIPDIGSLGDIEYALPEGLSNVENGLGYLVGIVNKKVPYEKCLSP